MLTKFGCTIRFCTLLLICSLAFTIRLFSVVKYESVIHEFDPYFNYRATKYLITHGYEEFLNWFDDKSWYPLGRNVGGTIYPGLMLTSASIYWLLEYIHLPVTVKDICVFIGPLFAIFSCISTYYLTKEITNNKNTSLIAAFFIAIVPSYISRCLYVCMYMYDMKETKCNLYCK